MAIKIYNVFYELISQWSPFIVKIIIATAMLAAGYVAGRLVERASIKIIDRVGLRRRVRFGLEKEIRKFGFSADIIQVVGVVIKYFIYFSTLLIVMDYLQIETAKGVVETIWSFWPRVLASILIVVVGSVIIEFITDIVKFNLRDAGLDRFADEAKLPKASNAAAKLVKLFLYLIVVLIALSQIGMDVVLLNTLTTSLVASMILAVMALIVLGVKDVLPDITAGIYMRNSLLLKAGDRITFGNVSGRIIRVGLVMMEIRSRAGTTYAPNSSVLRKSFSKL